MCSAICRGYIQHKTRIYGDGLRIGYKYNVYSNCRWCQVRFYQQKIQSSFCFVCLNCCWNSCNFKIKIITDLRCVHIYDFKQELLDLLSIFYFDLWSSELATSSQYVCYFILHSYYCFSVRVLPHDNDTAGLFCAVLTKTTELSWIRGTMCLECACTMTVIFYRFDLSFELMQNILFILVCTTY